MQHFSRPSVESKSDTAGYQQVKTGSFVAFAKQSLTLLELAPRRNSGKLGQIGFGKPGKRSDFLSSSISSILLILCNQAVAVFTPFQECLILSVTLRCGKTELPVRISMEWMPRKWSI